MQDDNAENFDFGAGNPSTFTVKEEKYGDESTRMDEERIKNANIAPEGYFYQTHYRIKIHHSV